MTWVGIVGLRGHCTSTLGVRRAGRRLSCDTHTGLRLRVGRSDGGHWEEARWLGKSSELLQGSVVTIEGHVSGECVPDLGTHFVIGDAIEEKEGGELPIPPP
uniref:Uncharacterized protein n=1 Tax=Chromera velia CCMP2878 TaxID=1169474 RepID=A0A0G4GJK0_9ALVE|eukprot:Cvel_22164.t1-p1 / transcript=Cvel_22164.t1 / gene=Cvel_22164 / organism=Chromera_velia_CCMP2878 / gene_product=hypothetical protein / transcript_product=hypothetical protein / location=Cvel_scaffold2151:24602-24904(-) / protein_length=101 / sequence_SO=supercontig / SO=protein_coding / is_pseudo=false